VARVHHHAACGAIVTDSDGVAVFNLIPPHRRSEMNGRATPPLSQLEDAERLIARLEREKRMPMLFSPDA
jgi:hypothetical protein